MYLSKKLGKFLTIEQLRVTPHTPQSETCRTDNVLYGILCSSCKSTVYVGETEWELGERMTEHRRDGHLNKDTPISAHFGKKEHGHDDVFFAVMEKAFGAECIERQLREAKWIKRFKHS